MRQDYGSDVTHVHEQIGLIERLVTLEAELYKIRTMADAINDCIHPAPPGPSCPSDNAKGLPPFGIIPIVAVCEQHLERASKRLLEAVNRLGIKAAIKMSGEETQSMGGPKKQSIEW